MSNVLYLRISFHEVFVLYFCTEMFFKYFLNIFISPSGAQITDFVVEMFHKHLLEIQLQNEVEIFSIYYCLYGYR